MDGRPRDDRSEHRRRGRRLRVAFGAGLYAAALLALAPGCSGRRGSPYKTEVTYTIPDDFRLAMLRFERRLEAHDVDGVLRSFDPVRFPHFRELERVFLHFIRRADQIDFTWRISDIKETNESRDLEVAWEMVFVDVLHAHRARRRSVSVFQWSRDPAPQLIGITRDRLFPDLER